MFGNWCLHFNLWLSYETAVGQHIYIIQPYHMPLEQYNDAFEEGYGVYRDLNSILISV